jgi:hypothetical protein
MPPLCNSSAIPRTVVIPKRLMSSTMPLRSAACWAALALIFATASALPTCLPLSDRAPIGTNALAHVNLGGENLTTHGRQIIASGL